MDKKFIRRKNYIIDQKFQFRLIGSFLILTIVSLLIFSAGFAAYYWIRYMAGENVFSEFIFIHKQIRIVNEQGEEGTKTEIQQPVNRLNIILPPMLINNLIIIVLIVVIGIFYSHRIAGPVYRMETDLDRVLNGEKGVTIRLRRSDMFKSLAAEINLLIEEHDELIKKIKE